MDNSVSKTTLKTLLGIIPLLFFSISIIHAQKEKPEKYYRVVAKMNQTTFADMKNKGLDVDHVHFEKEEMTAEISCSDLQLLRKNDIKVHIKIRNLSKRIPKINRRIDKKKKKAAKKAKSTYRQNINTPENFELGSMGGFFTLEEAMAHLDQMQKKYPKLITIKSSIGTSIEGRPINMVKISDNPNQEEADEEELLFTAIHHAREPIGLSQMVFYMWHLLENYENDAEIKLLVDHTALYFVPIINPDGYTYNQRTNPNGGGFWRKNRKNNQNGTFGVDLNRNYGYLWGTNGTNNTNSQTYQGTASFSEPETAAIMNFINQRTFITALNYHSFSNLLIYPWGHSANATTPENDTYVKMSDYMTQENGYVAGTPSQTLNVQASGSSDDWMYGEQNSKPRIFAFTPEVGSRNDGFWPASSNIISLCNDAFPLNLKIMRMGARYARVTPKEDLITIQSLEGVVSFDIERFSIKETAWTVSLTSTSQFIESTSAAKVYDNIDFLSTDTGDISFKLASTTPINSQIPLTLKVTNGIWEYTKELTVSYNGETNTNCTTPQSATPTDITSTSAALSWLPNPDSSKYTVRYKELNDTEWIILEVATNNLTLDSLKPETTYSIQVSSQCGGTNSLFGESTTFTTKKEILSIDTITKSLNTIRIFPNPVKTALTIKGAITKEDTFYDIFDLLGKNIKSGKINKEGRINITSLAAETYIILLKRKGKNRAIKFVKN